jgi:hypothetical protein
MSLQINIGVTPGREYMLEFMLTNLDRVLDYCNMKHETYISLLSEDPAEIENRNIAHLYDSIAFSENSPLHERYNDIISYNPERSDWILKLDMDCLVSYEFFGNYLDYKHKPNLGLLGFTRSLCFEPSTMRCKEINNVTAPIGTVFVHATVAKRFFSEGNLDGVLFQRIRSMGLSFVLDRGGTCVMDFKDGLNDWGYDEIGGKELF